MSDLWSRVRRRAAALSRFVGSAPDSEALQRLHALARAEAGRLGAPGIGPEHYLLALVGTPDCTGAQVLEQLGVLLEPVRQQLLPRGLPSPAAHGQELPLTSEGQRVLDLAREECRQLNNHVPETEHLLLGLLREGEGLPARMLGQQGVSLNAVRRHVYLMQVRTKEASARHR